MADVVDRFAIYSKANSHYAAVVSECGTVGTQAELSRHTLRTKRIRSTQDHWSYENNEPAVAESRLENPQNEIFITLYRRIAVFFLWQGKRMLEPLNEV